MGDYVVGPGKRAIWGQIMCKYMRCGSREDLEFTFRGTCAIKETNV